jgi:hypothetical protein
VVTSERIRWVGLPRIDVNTLSNSTPGFVPFDPEDIDTETKRSCSATFSDGFGSGFYPIPLTTNITIKGRGHFTWSRPKKPYNIVICGASSFAKRSLPMFGMPSDSDWTILADYDDFTHCRQLIAAAWGFGLRQWGARSLKAELYFNGAYYGLVTFCEKVSRTPARINIAKLNPADITAPAITGGYVLEGQDASYNVEGEQNFTDELFGSNWTFKIPDADAVVAEQVAYAKGVLDDFLARLYGQPPHDLAAGYRAVADATSLAQFLLTQDALHNPDGNSFYLTKDRGGLLQGGPFWDPGVALGAIETAWGPHGVDPTYPTLQEDKVPWWLQLQDDPFFAELLRSQFALALPRLHRAYADLRAYMEKLDGPETTSAGLSAIARDWAVWSHNDELFVGDFARNAPRMLEFIGARLHWLTTHKYREPGSSSGADFSNAANSQYQALYSVGGL